MKRYVIAASACLCVFALSASAQNYNPTVVVTNKYKAATETAQ